MNRETARLAELLNQAYFGEAPPEKIQAWHGASTAQALQAVAFDLATRAHPGASHTIWEITAHILQWNTICLRRLAGEELAITAGDEGDWPAPAERSPARWTDCLTELCRIERALVDRVSSLSDDFLELTVPGWPWTNYQMIHGTLHHDIFHTGQINLLRRLHAAK